MRDRELYARLLGIAPPWQVQDVELRLDDGEVLVRLAPGETFDRNLWASRKVLGWRVSTS